MIPDNNSNNIANASGREAALAARQASRNLRVGGAKPSYGYGAACNSVDRGESNSHDVVMSFVRNRMVRIVTDPADEQGQSPESTSKSETQPRTWASLVRTPQKEGSTAGKGRLSHNAGSVLREHTWVHSGERRGSGDRTPLERATGRQVRRWESTSARLGPHLAGTQERRRGAPNGTEPRALAVAVRMAAAARRRSSARSRG